LNYDNYNFILEAIKENGFKNNYNLGFFLIKAFLKYASDELKNNYNIVLEAVKQNCLFLEYASEELQNNKLFLIDCYNFIKEFYNIEINIFNNKFIKENIDILHLINNKNNLYNYLIENEMYNIIYMIMKKLS